MEILSTPEETPRADPHAGCCGGWGGDPPAIRFRAFCISCTALPYNMSLKPMDTVSVNRFRDNLKNFVEQVVNQHSPIKVTRRAGEDFVVVSAEDWEREQETLFVLQNSDLMKQIAASMSTHTDGQGYKPTAEEVDEITGVLR